MQASCCEILIIDDDETLLAAMRRCLRREFADCAFTFFSDPTAALDAIDRRRFSAVISDFRMPRLTGAALLAHVELTQPQALRILYTADPPAVESAAQLVLEKPHDFARLKAIIASLVSVTGLRTASVA